MSRHEFRDPETCSISFLLITDIGSDTTNSFAPITSLRELPDSWMGDLHPMRQVQQQFSIVCLSVRGAGLAPYLSCPVSVDWYILVAFVAEKGSCLEPYRCCTHVP